MNDWVYATYQEVARAGQAGRRGGRRSLDAVRRHPRGTPRSTRASGVLHLDAHADLRARLRGLHLVARVDHAQRDRRACRASARLVQVGIRDFGEAELAADRGARAAASTRSSTRSWRRAALDGDAAGASCATHRRRPAARTSTCPSTSTGSTPRSARTPARRCRAGCPSTEACALLEALVRGRQRIVGFDLNEVAPGPDGDEWDGNVGARLLYKMIGWALRSKS